MPAIPTMSGVPTPPTRNNPSTFDTLADVFLSWLPVFGAWITAVANAINALIGNLATATVGQSTTSLTMGSGAQSLTVQAGLAFAPGQTVKVASTVSPTTQFMVGTVTSYNVSTGALGVTVTAVTGAGTLAAWTVSVILYMGDGQGEVYLQFTSSTVLTLWPDIKGMGRLWLNTATNGWMTWLCPAGGLQFLLSSIVSPTINTTYYLYAYAGSSGLALEASTTGWTWDTSSGLRIAVKTGDLTRSLVGMFRLNGVSTGQFQDDTGLRGVLSWFSRQPKELRVDEPTQYTLVTPSTPTVIGTTPLKFLSWAGPTDLWIQASSSMGSGVFYTGLDATASARGAALANAGYNDPVHMRTTETVAEGLHTFDAMYTATSGGVWGGAAAAQYGRKGGVTWG